MAPTSRLATFFFLFITFLFDDVAARQGCFLSCPAARSNCGAFLSQAVQPFGSGMEEKRRLQAWH
jgi:polyferredoxin